MFWNKQPKYAAVQLYSQSENRQIIELFWLFVGGKHDPLELETLLINLWQKKTWKDMVEIDQSFRNHSYYYYSYDLRNISPDQFLNVNLSEEFHKAFLGLSTFAPNG